MWDKACPDLSLPKEESFRDHALHNYICNLHPNSRLLSTYPHIRTDLPGEKGKGIIMARDQTRHWGGGRGGG